MSCCSRQQIFIHHSNESHIRLTFLIHHFNESHIIVIEPHLALPILNSLYCGRYHTVIISFYMNLFSCSTIRGLFHLTCFNVDIPTCGFYHNKVFLTWTYPRVVSTTIKCFYHNNMLKNVYSVLGLTFVVRIYFIAHLEVHFKTSTSFSLWLFWMYISHRLRHYFCRLASKCPLVWANYCSPVAG